jgi:hypothetical protein
MDILDPANAIYAVGSEKDREQARREWHRQRFAVQVAASSLEQLQAADLESHRFSIVEHTPTGRLYRVRRDELPDLGYSTATAYYIAAGQPVLLEPPPGPETRQGVEARQEARRQRRAAKKPRPAWMNQ